MTIRLSRQARRDVDETRRYTVETWGREQWLTYYEGLVHTFERIAADPAHPTEDDASNRPPCANAVQRGGCPLEQFVSPCKSGEGAGAWRPRVLPGV